MFNCKLDSLFEKTSTSNGFVNAALQKSAETLTQNGAKTYSTTGDPFVIVMWNITNDYYDEHSRVNFDTYGNVKNTFYFGGYSASVLTFLFTGELKTTTDLYKAAMNQEILNLVQI